MYGFGEELTKENILKKITSYDIFRYYSENFKDIGKSFCSDLPGRTDENPSAQINVIKNDLLYRDFGAGKSFRAIDYVMVKKNLSYFEALELINQDFNLGLGVYTDRVLTSSKVKPVKTNIVLKEKLPCIIQIKKRDWNEDDYNYWTKRYYIPFETLELFGVVPVSHFWINESVFVADRNAYCYNFYWKEDNSMFYRKIYQPYSKKLKWVSNGGYVVQGEGVLPYKGNLLIVTKSLKDVIVLYNLGFTSVAPTSESSFLPNQYFLKQGERFSRIVIFFDTDATGLKKAKEFSEKFGVEYKYIPLEYKAKDISDFIEKNGVDSAKELLHKLFK